jgi:hypothetical protein
MFDFFPSHYYISYILKKHDFNVVYKNNEKGHRVLMNIDINKIINGTPYKRILNGYNTMKNEYNAESAKVFYDIYSNENLSDILENSRMIFSEPYIGLDFYKNIILEKGSCVFSELNNEYNKLDKFVTENADKMDIEQKLLYVNFRDEFKDYNESMKDVILISSYLKSGENQTFEKDLSNLMYNKRNNNSSADDIVNYISEKADLRLTMLYTPFIYDKVECSGKLNSLIKEKSKILINESADNSWSNYLVNVVVMNRLRYAKPYTEAVNENVHDFATKSIFLGLMRSDIDSYINNIRLESSKDANVIFHESSHAAIEDLFLDKIESDLFKEEFAADKKYITNCIREAVEAEYDLLSYEYSNIDNINTECKGYSMLDDGYTVESAYIELSKRYTDIITESEMINDFFEKGEDDIDDLYKDEEDESSNKNTSTSSQTKAPKTGNAINNLQNKAMDTNTKILGIGGQIKKVGEDIGNAAKAVVKLPISFINGLKAEVHKLDEMDDERRKAYLTAPGYRRSVFHKLKLAMLYGSAATINIALIPVIMTCRHFSKIKDKRMRAEALRDIEAEIKVCDAKIEDAQQSDDKSQRYQLIRIREKLNAELIRIFTNSKYI